MRVFSIGAAVSEFDRWHKIDPFQTGADRLRPCGSIFEGTSPGELPRPLWVAFEGRPSGWNVRSRTDRLGQLCHLVAQEVATMFCRIEVLRGKGKRVLCAHYKTGANFAEIDDFAWRECRTHGGDAYRIHNLHTDEREEVEYERL